MNRQRRHIAQPRTASFLILATLVTLSLTSVAGAQIYLYDRADFLATPNPAGVAVADFNRDGRPDMAVSDTQNSWTSILIATAKGGFVAVGTYATGFQPTALAAADFNRDKKIDLAVVNANSGTLSILLGNGDGTFQGRVDYPVGQGPAGIVAADFNSDGNVDLATITSYDSAVAITLGDGTGGFQVQALIPVTSAPSVLVAGDVNGDGKIDLITGSGNYNGQDLTVLLSHGDGTFTQVMSPAPYNVGSLAAADLNGDGKLDLLIELSYGSGLYFSLGNGDGSFQAAVVIANAPYAYAPNVLTGDFNHDGKVDLVLSGVWVMLGNGDGSFQDPMMFQAGNSPVAVVDFNGDGESDLVVTLSSGSVAVLLGKGDGSFMNVTPVTIAPASYNPTAGVAADFNGDGKLDMAVEEPNYPNAQVSVELGKGNGKFKQPIVSLLTSSGNSNGMLAADFNDDGKTDLVVLDDGNDGFQVLLGGGDGTFGTPVDTPLTYPINSFAVADFNGDGRADVAAAATANNSPFVGIFLGNGDGTFSLGQQYVVYPNSYISVADINGDGHQDLIVDAGNYTGYNLLVFLGDGDGTFRNPMFGPVDNYSSQAAVADFNRDGRLDIAVGTAGYPNNGVAFLAGNGDGTFQSQVYSDLGAQVTGQLSASDVNGDGKPDLVAVSGCCGPVVQIMTGNGDGTFGPARQYNSGSSGFPWIVGDFNSDGTSDLGIPGETPSYNPVIFLYLSVPTPALYPTAVNFGGIPVGQTSSPKKVKLTNTGNATLKITDISVSGDFLEQHNCGKALPVGKTCTIQVSFKPTAKGQRLGNLKIADNAPGSPHKVSLRGTGK